MAGDVIRAARERNGRRGQRSPSIEIVRRLLLVMGEELELTTRRMDADYDPVSMELELSCTPSPAEFPTPICALARSRSACAA